VVVSKATRGVHYRRGPKFYVYVVVASALLLAEFSAVSVTDPGPTCFALPKTMAK